MKEQLFGAFLRSPYPISRWGYLAARRWLYSDARTPMFKKAFSSVEREGDYLEFGVYRGSSFVNAITVGKDCGFRGRWFAFDSFQGLPVTENSRMTKGMFTSPRNTFELVLQKAGVMSDRVIIKEGLFCDTLNDTMKQVCAMTAASIVHVDCDLYDSTKTVLNFVASLCQYGTIIIFDDWYSLRHTPSPHLQGEQRAFLEWPHRAQFKPFFDIPNVTKAFIHDG